MQRGEEKKGENKDEEKNKEHRAIRKIIEKHEVIRSLFLKHLRRTNIRKGEQEEIMKLIKTDDTIKFLFWECVKKSKEAKKKEKEQIYGNYYTTGYGILASLNTVGENNHGEESD